MSKPFSLGFITKLFSRNQQENTAPQTNQSPLQQANDQPTSDSNSSQIQKKQTQPTNQNEVAASSTQEVTSPTFDSSLTDSNDSKASNNESMLSPLQRKKKGGSYTREFWMNDSEVKFCYECQTQFSTIVRKHHCRLCGQIFCNKCSQNTIKLDNDNSIRTCNACFRRSKTNKNTPTSNLLSNSQSSLMRSSTSVGPSASGLSVVESLYSSPASSSNTPRSDQEEYLSKNYRPVPLSANLRSYSLLREDSSKEDLASNSTDTRDSSSSNKQEDNNASTTFSNPKTAKDPMWDYLNDVPGPSPLPSKTEEESSRGSLEDVSPNEKETNSSNKSNNNSNSVTGNEKYSAPPRQLRKARTNELHLPMMELDADLLQASDAPETQTQQTEEITGSVSSPLVIVDQSQSEQQSVSTSNSERLSSKQLQTSDSVESLSNEGLFAKLALSPAVDKRLGRVSWARLSREAETKRKMVEAGDQYLREFVTQLIVEEHLDVSWFDLIMDYIQKATTVITPQIRVNGDKMDIREYVKVKIIPGGKKEESEYIEGMAFCKNLTHKKMRNNIEFPKVMLFNCAIEFQRNRLLLLDDVLSQEKSHLKNLVARISTLEPDIVIASQTVSRLAQDFLLEANIALAVNVKPKVIRRLARTTKADIVTSPSDVANANIGANVSKFYVKTYKGDWGFKPMMIFEGCPAELGCSILLRGADKTTLSKVKKVLLFGAFISYNIRLEISMLIDEYCTIMLDSNRFPLKLENDENEEKKEKTEETNSNVNLPKQNISLCVDIPRDSSNSLPTFFLPPSSNVSNQTQLSNSNEAIANPSISNNSSNSSQSTNDYENNPFAVEVSPQFVQLSELDDELDLAFAGDMKSISKENQALGVRYVDINSNSTTPNAYESQKIVYLHSLCCSTNGKHCVPFRIHVIDFYSKNDLPLGEFLEQYCFNRSYRCQGDECSKSIIEHDRSFIHSNGRINISIYSSQDENYVDASKIKSMLDNTANTSKIFMWTFCKVCKQGTPIIPMKEETWNYSFGKYLEICFYGVNAVSRIKNCSHAVHKHHTRYFYYENLIAVFDNEEIDVNDIVVPGYVNLPSSKSSSTGLSVNDDITYENVFQVAQESYSTILRKLNQLEIEYKGVRDEELLQLMKGYQEQKQKIFEELDTMKGSDLSLIKLHTLVRNLYLQLISWEEVLSEHFYSLKKKKVASSSSNGSSVNISLSNSIKTTIPSSPTSQSSTLQHILISDQLQSDSESASPSSLSQIKPSQELGDSSLPSGSPSTLAENTGLSIPSKQDTPTLINASVSPSNVVSFNTPMEDTTNPPSSALSNIHNAHIRRRSMTEKQVNELRSSKGTPTISPSLDSSKSEISTTNKPTIMNAIRTLLQFINQGSITTSSRPLFFKPGVNDKTYVVFEDEPSSAIANSLSSIEYAQKFDTLPKTQKEKELAENLANYKGTRPDIEDNLLRAHLLSKNRNEITTRLKYTTFNFKINTSVTTYYAKQFYALRKFYCNGEEEFVRAIGRCKSWKAVGGKTRSKWSKTLDDRFILKQVSRIEYQSFLEIAPFYFEYLSNALFQQVPTILAKIFGIYTIKAENKDEHHLIILENLFYDKVVTKRYDLKGSTSARWVKADSEVLLDSNLLEVMFASPFWVHGSEKANLQAAIWNDSLFLSEMEIMDYSLLVGVCPLTNQTVVGIIDYLRKYTFDKKVETELKLVVGRGKIPTIIEPIQYKIRFREAMNLYFVQVPDRNTHLKSKKQEMQS